MKTVALGEVCEFLSGGTPDRNNSEFYQGELPWISGADVNTDGIRPRSFITEDAVKCTAARRVPEGTVLLVTRTSVGKVAVANTDLSYSQDITAVIPNHTVNKRFLVHFLRAQQSNLKSQSRGATIKGVTRSVVAGLRFPLIEVREQRRIADILDKADVLRAKRWEAIAHLDSLGQSIFHDMFGSPSVNERRWEMRQLGEVLVSTQYGTSEKSAQTGTVPVLRMGNLTYGGKLDLSDLKFLVDGSSVPDKYLLRKGDVLFNRTNSPDLVGKTALFAEEGQYAFAGYLIRLRCSDALHPAYLAAFMNTKDMKTKLRSMCKSIVGMANINAKEVSNIGIMLPPLKSQHEFADKLATLAAIRSVQCRQLDELDSLFMSLQDRAFKGEL